MAVTLAPEGHIRKRQFQPSISSYFTNRDGPPSSAPERARSPLSPPLPEETQASLLSVGMRVRKSVPEGYKTHKTMGLPDYPFSSTAPARKMERIHTTGSVKELMPFCGLHKIGGWGAQQAPSSSAPGELEGWEDDEDDMAGMTMSQDTLLSTQVSFGINERTHAGNSRKRTYEEEVEEDLDAYFDVLDSDPVPVQRPIAKLKQAMRRPEMAEQNARPHSGAGDNDFNDALFLAPQEGMDVDDF